MSTPITIRVFRSEIRIETEQGSSATVPIQDRASLTRACMGWVRHIATVCEKYSQQVALTGQEQTEVLRVLAGVGQRITLSVFNGRKELVQSLLKQYSGRDIRILGSEDTWIPWELLYLGDFGKSLLNDFCGFKRNIYRARPSRGQTLEIAGVPSVGFLAHRKAPFAMDEYGFLKNLGKNEKIVCQEWVNLIREAGGKETLLDQLEHLNIVHFAGLIVPVQYVEQSSILVEDNFWIAPDDLREPVSSREAFSFKAAPLVVLNVRDNYTRDPWQVSQYVKLLLDLRAVGVIASEFPIPPILAEKFAERFYSCLFKDGKSISQALADTKGHFLEKCNNPFAMFYAPYFEPSGGLGNRVEEKTTYELEEIFTEIRECMRQGQLEKALGKLSRLEKCQVEAITLTSRLSRVRRQNRLGTITRQQAEAEYAQITEAILQIVSL